MLLLLQTTKTYITLSSKHTLQEQQPITVQALNHLSLNLIKHINDKGANRFFNQTSQYPCVTKF